VGYFDKDGEDGLALVVVGYPIPFSPWWLGIICTVVFILLIVMLKPNSK